MEKVSAITQEKLTKSEEEKILQNNLNEIDDRIEVINEQIDNIDSTIARGKNNSGAVDKYLSEEIFEDMQKEHAKEKERLELLLKRLYEQRENVARQLQKYIVRRVSKNSKNNNRYMEAVKNMLFDNQQSTTLQTDGKNKKNIEQIKEAVKYIVEEVMLLTPREYDAIYSNSLNQKAHIDYAVRKIVETADMATNRKTLFVSKQTLFALVWPEYYNTHYKSPKPWKIFNATGEVKSGFIRAGKPRTEKDSEEGVGRKEKRNGEYADPKKKKAVMNHGVEVDRMVYWAMKEMFSLVEDLTDKQLFLALADPKGSGWGNYGFVKIIEARQCYASPLDFYMLNSPTEYQLEHIEDYFEAREEANLKHIYTLDKIRDAYEMAISASYGYHGPKKTKAGSDVQEVER